MINPRIYKFVIKRSFLLNRCIISLLLNEDLQTVGVLLVCYQTIFYDHSAYYHFVIEQTSVINMRYWKNPRITDFWFLFSDHWRSSHNAVTHMRNKVVSFKRGHILL